MIKIQHTIIRTGPQVDAWQPNITSPFCVFKHHDEWTAAHILSRQFITSIVPKNCKTRAKLIAWLERMESDIPDAVLECHAFEPPPEALAVIKKWSESSGL